jgi:transposase
MARCDLERFVFLDESGAKTNMTRRYGWADRGERCHFAVPHGHWETTTMVSAIRADGVIEEATLVLDGPMNGATFRGYVERMLAPALRADDIVLMDNLAAHKVSGVVEAIEAHDAELWYLPPYSPDLNPIEKLWSKIKSTVRQLGERTWQGLVDAIALAFHQVSLDECRNYFRSCGYATK